MRDSIPLLGYGQKGAKTLSGRGTGDVPLSSLTTYVGGPGGSNEVGRP